MSIQNAQQLENTRAKLALLEERLRRLESEPATNAQTRELTKRSLTKLANQLREEIARYSARRVVAAG